MRWDTAGLDSLIIQLIENPDKIGTGTSSDPTVQAMAIKLLGHHFTKPNLEQPSEVMMALNLCTKLQVAELSNNLFSSFKFSSHFFVQDVLIPSLPQLRQWALQNNRDVDNLVRRIFTNGLEKWSIVRL
jgi:hypothetical protein